MNQFLSISIVLCFLQLTATDVQMFHENNHNDDYSFSVGSSNLTPKENMKEFFKNKKDFSENLYEDTYFVIIQFKKPISKSANYEGFRQKINLIHEINELTYIASFDKKTSKGVFKKFKVRSIVPITTSMKLEKGVKELIDSRKEIKVNLVVSKSIDKSFIMKRLKALEIKGATEIFKETNKKYMISLNKDQLNKLADYPWVIQIELGGMR